MRYLILLGVLALAIVGYTVFWFSLSGRLEQGVQQWAAAAQAQGMQVEYKAVSVTGYPFRLIANVKDVDWHFPNAGGDLDWRAGQLRLVTEPWAKGHVIILFDPHQTLTLTDAEGSTRDYVITSDNARASLVMQQPGGARFAFAVNKLDVLASASGQHMAAGELQFYLRDLPPKPADKKPDASADPSLPTTAQADFMAKDVTLPSGRGGGLGDRINSLQAEVVVNGEIPGLRPDQLKGWVASGGTMDITGFKADWGNLNLEAAGTLTLDDSNRPLGAFEARFKGIQGVLDALDLLGESDTSRHLARSALEAAESGRKGEWIKVPFTLQNGFFYLGSIPLTTLSPVTE